MSQKRANEQEEGQDARKEANCSGRWQGIATCFGGHGHAANRLRKKAAEEQNTQNHYDSDYDDLDQTHNDFLEVRTKSG